MKWKAVLVVGAKESLKDSESFYYFRLLLAILIPYILLKSKTTQERRNQISGIKTKFHIDPEEL